MTKTTPAAPSTATDYRRLAPKPTDRCDYCGWPALFVIVSEDHCPETGYQDVACFCRECAEERLS